MATDARGHTAPAAGETPRRQVINDLSLSINDPIVVANATARAAKIVELAALVPAITPSSSRPIFFFRSDALAGCELEYTTDGTTFRTVPAGGSGPWSTYTPTLTAVTTSPTLGSGAVQLGKYVQVGRTVDVQFNITFGSSGAAAGSGVYLVSLPVNMGITDMAGTPVGTVWLYDASSLTSAVGVAYLYSTSQVQMRVDGVAGAVAHAVPWAWATGDAVRGTLRYEAA